MKRYRIKTAWVVSLFLILAILSNTKAQTVDLATHQSTDTPPVGATFEWHNALPASAANLMTPAQIATASSGLYYGVYNLGTCYSAPSDLRVGAITSPATTADLNTFVDSTAKPAGMVTSYHTGSPATSANRMTDLAVSTAPAGTYFAAYYDPTSMCYTQTSPIVLTGFSCLAGTTAPSVSATTLSNICPATTVNLNSLHTSTAPSGARLRWHTVATNPTALDSVATPSVLATVGTYYAYYFDEISNCYSPAKAVTVTIHTNPAAPTATEIQPTCSIPTGTITITNPTSGVTYSFDNGTTYQASAISGALMAGTTYQVKVKNNTSNCVSTATSTAINAQPASPTISSVAKTDPSVSTCPALNDGSITVTATGSNLQYSKDNGATWQASNQFTGLVVGAYAIKVKDSVSICEIAYPSNSVVLTAICPATFAFNCGNAISTSTFSANGTGGQTGTLIIPITVVTGGSATFTVTVTGTGFTGTLSTILTAAQASVTVPITYDGMGAARIETLTITSTEGSGTCTKDVTVLTPIQACLAGLPFLSNLGGLVTTPLFCSKGNYNYYKAAANSSQEMLAINPNGNTFNPISITLDASITATHTTTSNGYTAALAYRMVSINAPGTFNVNGGLHVRIYYNPLEFLSLPSNARRWFKHPAQTKAGVLADLTSTGLNNATLLNPDSTGTENALSFVEFFNVQSFSTFGYMGISCTNPTIDSVTKTDPSVSSCPALNDGSMSITAAGSNLEYSIDNGATYQSSNQFTGLVAGAYTLKVKETIGGCETTYAANPVILTAPSCNVAPVMTSGTTATTPENVTTTTAIYTATATDANGGQTQTYSFETGGVDNSFFTINATTGAVTFNTSPDFEIPIDAGANNVYNIKIKVCDDGTPSLCSTQDVALTVTNVAECLTPSVGGTTATAAMPICPTNNFGVITLTGQTGTVVKWQTSTNNGTSWTDIAMTTTTLKFTNAANNQQYRAVVNNSGACVDALSTATIITLSASACLPDCNGPKTRIINH